jgi:hypothetical protein
MGYIHLCSYCGQNGPQFFFALRGIDSERSKQVHCSESSVCTPAEVFFRRAWELQQHVLPLLQLCLFSYFSGVPCRRSSIVSIRQSGAQFPIIACLYCTHMTPQASLVSITAWDDSLTSLMAWCPVDSWAFYTRAFFCKASLTT